MMKEKILKGIKKRLNEKLTMKDKFIFGIFRRYTYTIYKMGFNDGFNWNNDK